MPQRQFLTSLGQIHLTEETAGQDTYRGPQGDGSGMFLAENVSWTIDSTMRQANYLRQSGQRSDPIRGTVAQTITFDVPLKGSGTIDSAPEIGEALKACGLEETVTGSTSVEYTPLLLFDGLGGNPGTSYSVTVLERQSGGTVAVAYGISGAYGNVSFSGAVGEPMMMSFTFTGAWQPAATDALETGANAPSYDTTIAPSFVGATMAFNPGAEGSVQPLGVENLSLDCGNTVRVGMDVSQTFGVYGTRITSRRSTGSFDADMDTIANADYLEHWEESKACTLSTGVVGSTAGNRWQLDVNRMVINVPEMSDVDGVRKITLPFDVTALHTDEEGDEPDWKLTFT